MKTNFMEFVNCERDAAWEEEAEDSKYEGSYDDMFVHATMLQDGERVRAYTEAFQENREYFRNAVVVDVGSGTGILSLLVAKLTEAKKVYALEQSARLAQVSRELAETNGLASRIEVVHTKAEDWSPGDGFRADILVSEWMGNYLVHEGMLGSIISVRNAFLRQGRRSKDAADFSANPDSTQGLLFPERAVLFASLCECSSAHYRHIGWIDESDQLFSGLCLKTLKEHMDIHSPIIEQLESNDSISFTDPTIVADLDLYQVQHKHLQAFSVPQGSFPIKRQPPRIGGVALWFDCFFPGTRVLSTAPGAPPTHWKQTLVLLPQNLQPPPLNHCIKFELKISKLARRQYYIQFEVTDVVQSSTTQ